jgi:hypothetical protein
VSVAEAAPPRPPPAAAARRRQPLREPSPRAFAGGVVACTLLLAAFLLARLRAWPPHEDEVLVLFVGRGGLDELLDTVLGERGGAPLHFLLAWPVAQAGGGLTGLRALSAVFAVASVPLVAALTARLGGRAAALVATASASLGWVVLFHGIYGRMYSLFLCTSALSYLLLLRALERGGRRAWAAWVAAILVCVAAHPYGALVVASQGLFVLIARARVREAILAFGAVAILGIPFWIADLVLAGRFDVGVGGGGEQLAGPLSVLGYLAEVAGDFSIGYAPLLALVLAVAGVGAWTLARRRPRSALLVACVFATPTAALLFARLGSGTSPETRHLIFALPFFALLVGAGAVRLAERWRNALPVALAGAAVLVAGQVAWAHEKTPALFEGDPASRVAGREAAADWLARTARPDDVLLGYEPVFLDAWRRNDDFPRLVLPRADPKLAAQALAGAGAPLGRGVWVFDAYDTTNFPQRLSIERRLPHPRSAFEARVFGPYLVIRSREPTRTARRYLEQASQVMIVGKSLWIGDADINFVTVRRAAARLGLL